MLPDQTELFHSLGEDTRFFITLLLFRHKELCVCELTTALTISQPKVSRHLAHLRGKGILQNRRSEQWMHYSIIPEVAEEYKEIFEFSCNRHKKELLQAEERLGGMMERPAC